MAPMQRKVSATPMEFMERNASISITDNGDAIIAPPPKPIMAMPVAIPGRSGNHLIKVDTGDIYPSPSPIPPRNPWPKYTSQIWCVYTPIAAMKKPPEKQRADTNMASRGPTRSNHFPNIAAEAPSVNNAIENIHPKDVNFQSKLVDSVIPITWVIGLLNTLYA